MLTGTIFDLKRCATHDGPGLRTVVFLKGCSMRCAWCHSPESQSPLPELMFSARLCIGCRECLSACPSGLLLNGPGEVDRARCQACGACAEGCYAGALRVVGRKIGADDLAAQLLRDGALHRASGGGVTVSGGEPALQPEFVAALLTSLRTAGEHVAIETAGHAPWDTFHRAVEHAHLVMYDVKHADAGAHARLTGVSNELTLGNLWRLSAEASEQADARQLTVRVPVIPGANDDMPALRQLAALLTALPHLDGVELLPYHHLGVAKYQALGRHYGLPSLETHAASAVSRAASVFSEAGLRVKAESGGEL